MPLYAVDHSAARHLQAWRQAPDLALHLLAPAKNKRRDMFDGIAWLVIVRIIVPIMAFASGADAIAEAQRVYTSVPEENGSRVSAERRDARLVSLVFCCIEAPPMFIFGSALSFGLYGPNKLPVQLLSMAFTQFQGLSAFTTMLLGLFLDEETRALNVIGQQPRPVFRNNRGLVAFFFIIFVVPDLVGAAMCFTRSFYNSTSWNTDFVSELPLVIYVSFNIAAMFYFLKTANVLRGILGGHFLQQQAISGADVVAPKAAKAKRFMFWLGISTTFLFTTSLAVSTYALAVNGSIETSDESFFYIIVLLSFSRIAVSYSQIQAISPADAARPSERMLVATVKCLLCCCCDDVTATTTVSPLDSSTTSEYIVQRSSQFFSQMETIEEGEEGDNISECE